MNGENDNSCMMVCVKTAAAMLGVSERTIWRMIADGQLAAVRFRHCTRISMEQIQNILKGGGKAGAL